VGDYDRSDDRDVVSRHVQDFVRTGVRRTADELAAKALGPSGTGHRYVGAKAIDALMDDKG
jgi:hypothetical protein